MQDIAQREKCRREQEDCNVRIKAQKAKGKESREHGGAQQRAMREINDVKHAVDQRQSKRNQRIDCADQQAVEDRGDEDDGRQH